MEEVKQLIRRKRVGNGMITVDINKVTNCIEVIREGGNSWWNVVARTSWEMAGYNPHNDAVEEWDILA